MNVIPYIMRDSSKDNLYSKTNTELSIAFMGVSLPWHLLLNQAIIIFYVKSLYPNKE
jgi:hypothetical protein